MRRPVNVGTYGRGDAAFQASQAASDSLPFPEASPVPLELASNPDVLANSPPAVAADATAVARKPKRRKLQPPLHRDTYIT